VLGLGLFILIVVNIMLDNYKLPFRNYSWW